MQVRCDGRGGLCRNCDRLGFECSFQQAPEWTPGGQYALKPPERRRRTQACIPCHSKKTRCRGEWPRCSDCIRKNRNCVYPPKPEAQQQQRQQQQHPPGEAPAGGGGGEPMAETACQRTPMRDVLLPSQDDVGTVDDPVEGAPLDAEIAMDLTEAYFRHLYPLPSFAFLHEQTVVQRCRDGTINEPLKLAICAIAALLLQRTALCHDLWARRAEKAVLRQIGRPSVFHLQALLLVIRHRIESGEFPTAFMLAALAARAAVALRLNYERPELPPVAQEARRRCFWSVYLLDDWFCVGLREFDLCPEETIHLQVPCAEDVFESGRQSRTGPLRPWPSDTTDPTTTTTVDVVGLRGSYVRLISARRAIMRFNRRVGLGEEPASMIGASIRRFEEDLKALGPPDRYSRASLAASGWKAQFVLLHMAWHQCHGDLYRIFLNGYGEAAPSPVLSGVDPRARAAMQLRCLGHCEETLQIVDDASGLDGCLLLLERDAAVCAFESARLVMFGARVPSAASSLDVAVSKARSSLRFITKFFPYSASTLPLRKELERLIASYSVRLALQTQDALSEPDAPAPRSSSRVSQYANARQRLSVQSLLLQSDFVDDSHEIVGPTTTPSSIQQQTQRRQQQQQQRTLGAANNDKPDPTSAPQASQSGNRGVGMATAAVPAPGGSGAAWNGGGGGGGISVPSAPGQIPQGNHDDDDHDHDHLQPPLPAPPPSCSDGGGGGGSSSLTMDAAGQEDAGLIFNPWMGFSGGNDDIYGLSGNLDEEY